MKKMKYYTEIWELNTLTFPLFRYYHIKVKAMNVHSKILFSWQRGKPTGWKASWGSSRIEIPTRAAYRKNSRAESMDLVGYDVSSLVTWVKSLIVNVKIASRSFHFSHKEFGWYRGYKIRPNGVNLYARFFVTIQSQWRSSLNEQRTGKPVLQVSIADAILRMRLWIVTIWKCNTHPGTSKNTCATRHSVQNSTVCRIAHRNEE